VGWQTVIRCPHCKRTFSAYRKERDREALDRGECVDCGEMKTEKEIADGAGVAGNAAAFVRAAPSRSGPARHDQQRTTPRVPAARKLAVNCQN
jgi:hypothetical protein